MDKKNITGNTRIETAERVSEPRAIWEHPQAIEFYSGDKSAWCYDIFAKELLVDIFGRDEVAPAEMAWAAWIVCGMRADEIINCCGVSESLANELQTLLFFGPELQRRWLARNRLDTPALPSWMLPGEHKRVTGDSPKDKALRDSVAEDDFCRAWLALHGAKSTNTRMADSEVRDWLKESFFYF